jgi:phosphoglycolate phosphatase-like HAD superfamily hydrolase
MSHRISPARKRWQRLDRSLRQLQGPAGPAEVRGVLLDVEGTLVDSGEAHTRAWQDALAESGYGVPRARILRMLGMGETELVALATGLRESDPAVGRIAAKASELFVTRELEGVAPWPDTRGLLERLRHEGLRLAVASSAPAREIGVLLEHTGLAGLLEAPTPSSGLEPSDPNPVHAALARADLRPSEAVMVGDTPYDQEMARLANVVSVLFRTGGWPDVQLAGALALYDGPWDLLARFADSPLKGRLHPGEAEPPGLAHEA